MSEEEKNELESKFWLMVLRAGGMDPEKGFEVLMNFIRITNNYPDYFAASKPPTKLDCVFQQKVFLYINAITMLRFLIRSVNKSGVIMN